MTPLGPQHWAFFSELAPILLVTFETVEDIRDDHPSQMPMGYRIAAAKGWSSLCLIADGPTWWRDPEVYLHFDQLTDSGFMDFFDHILFFGAGAGGYAAAAYSAAAPGAAVLALQPCATLDPTWAGWDRRHLSQRRLNFTDRYGYAPDMIEAAAKAFLILDPGQPEDAMHAALFRAPNVIRLECRYLGERTDLGLLSMGLLPGLIEHALAGDLTPALFARMWRGRRTHRPYLSNLIAVNLALGQRGRAIKVCRFAAETLNDLRFKRRLYELERESDRS